MAMETYIVTIPITTDMDSSQLLDIINTQISQMVNDEIESYGYEVEIDENEITVENLNE
jgi:5'-3' exonuclease